MAILEIENMSKKYKDKYCLQGIHFTVEKGEWVAIMGPSGSGKSTFINMIGCLDKPTEGFININGKETTSLNKKQLTKLRRETIGLVFQQFHLIPHLNALENVMLAQYYHSMQDQKEAYAALKQVGLEERVHYFPAQLSGGEQQRVCIARALINYPALLLADEPTGNLDEANEKIVMQLFRELHQKGHTILMVTHDHEVAACAERTIVLENGGISRVIENTDRPSPHTAIS
jgi:putative ABC transport system ATP-binding protein